MWGNVGYILVGNYFPEFDSYLLLNILIKFVFTTNLCHSFPNPCIFSGVFLLEKLTDIVPVKIIRFSRGPSTALFL